MIYTTDLQDQILLADGESIVGRDVMQSQIHGPAILIGIPQAFDGHGALAVIRSSINGKQSWQDVAEQVVSSESQTYLGQSVQSIGDLDNDHDDEVVVRSFAQDDEANLFVIRGKNLIGDDDVALEDITQASVAGPYEINSTWHAGGFNSNNDNLNDLSLFAPALENGSGGLLTFEMESLED